MRPRIHPDPLLSSRSKNAGWWGEKKATMTNVCRGLSAQRVAAKGAEQ